MAYAIRAEGLRKRFKKTDALVGATLDVPEGSVFGLIGPNGSGKTTLLHTLLGLLEPDAGRSEVLGEDSRALSRRTRQRIGFLSEDPFPYDALPIDDLLRYVSAFFDEWDWPRTADLLDRLRVPRDKTLAAMSMGQRRRAELLLALAQDPDVLVLDDPAIGLDATVRRQFLWSALELARNAGKTVLFTSHVLHDVERIVDTVAFLRDGRVRIVTGLDELKARTKRLVVAGAAAPPPPVPGEETRAVENGVVTIVTSAFTPEVAARLRAAGARVDVEDLNLEDIFIALSGDEP